MNGASGSPEQSPETVLYNSTQSGSFVNRAVKMSTGKTCKYMYLSDTKFVSLIICFDTCRYDILLNLICSNVILAVLPE